MHENDMLTIMKIVWDCQLFNPYYWYIICIYIVYAVQYCETIDSLNDECIYANLYCSYIMPILRSINTNFQTNY